MVVEPSPRTPRIGYSVVNGASTALHYLLLLCEKQIPEAAAIRHARNVLFTASPGGDVSYFPTPLREQETVAAIKALEACLAASIADLRHGAESRMIEVDVERAACFLMSAYLTTIDGMDKGNPLSKKKIPGQREGEREGGEPLAAQGSC